MDEFGCHDLECDSVTVGGDCSCVDVPISLKPLESIPDDEKTPVSLSYQPGILDAKQRQIDYLKAMVIAQAQELDRYEQRGVLRRVWDWLFG